MNVLEIIPSGLIEGELFEHIGSLQESSINLVLGITNEDGLNDPSRMASLSKFPIVYYDLNQFSWRAYFRNINNAGASNEDKNLAYIIEKHKLDLVHFYFSGDALQMHHKLLELSIPYTVRIHSGDIYAQPLEDEGHLQALYNLFNSTAGIQVTYDTLASKVKELCPTCPPITTIRMPIRTPNIIPSSVNTNKHLISIGELSPGLGFHDLVRAMVHMPDYSLDIIGDGLDKRHLVFLIYTYNLQDRVKLLDDIPLDQCEELITKSTAYIHSGIVQEASYHLLLAMALGKPVFVTNHWGVDEIVEDQHNGIHIPLGEPRAMAEKFKLLEDSDLMQKIGQNARSTIEKLCAPDTHAEQVLQFYQNASDNAGR